MKIDSQCFLCTVFSQHYYNTIVFPYFAWRNTDKSILHSSKQWNLKLVNWHKYFVNYIHLPKIILYLVKLILFYLLIRRRTWNWRGWRLIAQMIMHGLITCHCHLLKTWVSKVSDHMQNQLPLIHYNFSVYMTFLFIVLSFTS